MTSPDQGRGSSTGRAGMLVVVAVMLGGTVLVVPAVLMLMAVTEGGTEVASGCQGSVATSGEGRTGAEALGPSQLSNAATVIGVGSRMRVPPRGILIALAVAHQESRFRNYANDGQGHDLKPDQVGVEASMQLPHDAVGTDHGSLGIFQQQWPWWGTMTELMDPGVAARKFYERLLTVPGWQEMALTDAAQAVQRSAYPHAYADDETVAVELLSGSAPSGEGSAVGVGWAPDSSACLAPASFTGAVVAPIPAIARYSDLRNYGANGPHWAHGHTGTDFSAPCGTPAVAAHDGTVEIDTGESWAGRWLVEVSAGPGRLSTWYAHLQSLSVTSGQTVAAGQPIGEVGALGNATGCHLHFEVHPRGGGIYEDSVDPSDWLEKHLSTDVEQVVAEAATPSDFMIATFNVLGHSHTKPGGNKPGWTQSPERMRWAIELFDRYGVAVVGLQEFEPIQKRALLAMAGDRYEVYSPKGDTANSIAWHRGRFALVDADTFTIPYFEGKPRQMPIVRLRDRVTGQDSIFLNVHNPADTRRHPNQGKYRREAVRRERATIRSLASRYELPIYFMGDLNARHGVFCTLTADGILGAAAGGSHNGRCRPPAYRGIDWIFGARTAWAGHWEVRDSVKGRVSDHPFVLAQVTSGAGVGGAD